MAEGGVDDIMEPVPSNALEPRRMSSEPGITFDESDYRSHHNVYVAVHIPYSAPRKHKHKKHHPRRHGDRRNSEPLLPTPEHNVVPKTPLDPCDRVKFILGAEEDSGNQCSSHTIFTELEELNEKMEWKETARWIKFEEDVEEGGDKWSKPHVASLSLHSLFQLRGCITKGTVILDLAANNLEQISDYVLDDLVTSKQLDASKRDLVRMALLQKHRHQGVRDHEHRFLPQIKSFGDLGRFNRSTGSNTEHGNGNGNGNGNGHKNNNGSESVDGAGGNNGNGSGSGGHTLHLPHPSSLHSHFPFSMPNMMKGRFKKGGGGEGGRLSVSEQGSGGSIGRNPSDDALPKNPHFMKKIPPGSEASNVLVGEVDFLSHPIIAFVRLDHGVLLGDLTEVPIPTRFLFILLGPRGNRAKYHEIGRSIATLMSDEVFHDVAYKARNRDDLLAGVDEFLDKVTVLPPGEWDPHIRLEPPSEIPSQADRRVAATESSKKEEERKRRGREPQSSLVCSKWPFNGLIRDVKRRYPKFRSDITDAFSLQALASIIFIYFANIPPAITFGGVLSAKTDDHMGPLEMILAVGIGNFVFSIFAGQPLVVLGSTGPALIFEDIVYRFCSENGLPYLNFRFWIGMWTSIMMILLVASNASVIMRLFTRFTEEIFSSLISFIFIYEAFDVLLKLRARDCGTSGSVLFTCWKDGGAPSSAMDQNLSSCSLDFLSSEPITSDQYSYPCNGTVMWSYFNGSSDALLQNATAIVSGCSEYMARNYVVQPFVVGKYLSFLPDVSFSPDDAFLMSAILFAGTFFTSFYLKRIRQTGFFTAFIRRLISDFAVPIAVVIWVSVNLLTNYHTCTLTVPDVFVEGLYSKGSGRNSSDFLINPFGNGLPPWAPFAAIIPAALATVLLFMDQQITALIVNRKDNLLKKGSGYHLDMLIVGVLIFVHSLLGLPWVVGATVRSITHVQSLFRYSPTAAPGERPKFLGVCEQRVTLFCMSILLCLSVVAFQALRLLPEAVLYGIFLYIGVASLYGVQFVQRLLLFIIPDKYKPDYEYLRHIPNRKIYLYTLVQVAFLGLLCVFKVVSQISIVFPVMVLLLVIGRWLIGFVFSRRDLEILDDPISEKLYCRRFRTSKEGEKDKTAIVENGELTAFGSENDSPIMMRDPHEEEEKKGGGGGGGGASGSSSAKQRKNRRKRVREGDVIEERRDQEEEINMSREVDRCQLWRSMLHDYNSPPTASPARSRRPTSINVSSNSNNTRAAAVAATAADRGGVVNPLISITSSDADGTPIGAATTPGMPSVVTPTPVGTAASGVELPPQRVLYRSTAV